MSALFSAHLEGGVFELFVVIAVASSMVSFAALVACVWLKYHPSLRHWVLLSALICVLLSPLPAFVFAWSEIAIVSIPLRVEPTGSFSSSTADVSPSHENEEDSNSLSDVRESLPPTDYKTLSVNDEIDIAAGESHRQPVAPAAQPEVATKMNPSLGEDATDPVTDYVHVVGVVSFVTWGIGATILLLGTVRNSRRWRIVMRSSTLVEDPRVMDLLDDVRRILNVAKLPAIHSSLRVDTPVVVGLWRPLVVLPAHSPRAVRATQMRDALIHEIAHVLRCDHVVLIMQAIAGAVFWPNPLIYLLNRQLDRAREEACDNYVLADRNPIDYGETLLRFAELAENGRPLPGSIGMLPRRGKLEDRISAFLDDRRKTMIRPNRFAASAIMAILVVMCVMICGSRFVAAQAEPPLAATDRTVPEDERATKAGEQSNTAKLVGTDEDGDLYRFLVILGPEKSASSQKVCVDQLVNVGEPFELRPKSGLTAKGVLSKTKDGKLHFKGNVTVGNTTGVYDTPVELGQSCTSMGFGASGFGSYFFVRFESPLIELGRDKVLFEVHDPDKQAPGLHAIGPVDKVDAKSAKQLVLLQQKGAKALGMYHGTKLARTIFLLHKSGKIKSGFHGLVGRIDDGSGVNFRSGFECLSYTRNGKEIEIEVAQIEMLGGRKMAGYIYVPLPELPPGRYSVSMKLILAQREQVDGEVKIVQLSSRSKSTACTVEVPARDAVKPELNQEQLDQAREQQKAAAVVAQDHVRTAKRQPDTELLMTWFLDTWFLDGGTRGIQQCWMQDSGLLGDYSGLYTEGSFRAAGSGRIGKIKNPQLAEVRELLSDLPKEPTLPPPARMLIVTCQHESKWTTRIYDRADIPEAINRLYALAGARLLTWVPVIEPEASVARHQNWVYSIAVSPDGKLLASGSRDSTAKIWDITSGKLLHTVAEHGRTNVLAVGFSPDSKFMASASDDQIILTDCESGQSKSMFRDEYVHRLEFSPNGKVLAAAGGRHTLMLEVSEPYAVSKIPDPAVRSIAFSSDGQLLATGSRDQAVRVWDSKTRQQRLLLRHDQDISDLDFSPDGKWLAVSNGWSACTVHVWRVNDGKLQSILSLEEGRHTEHATAVRFSPDGKWLAVGTAGGGAICLWRVSTWRHLAFLSFPDGRVMDLEYSKDGKTLYASGAGNVVRKWNLP